MVSKSSFPIYPTNFSASALRPLPNIVRRCLEPEHSFTLRAKSSPSFQASLGFASWAQAISRDFQNVHLTYWAFMLGLSHNWAMAEDGAVLAGHYLGYCDYYYISTCNFFFNSFVFQYNSHYDILPCHGCATSNFPSKSIFLLWTQEKFFKNCFSSSLIRHWIFFNLKIIFCLLLVLRELFIPFSQKNRRMAKIKIQWFVWLKGNLSNFQQIERIKSEVKQNLAVNYLWVN